MTQLRARSETVYPIELIRPAYVYNFWEVIEIYADSILRNW